MKEFKQLLKDLKELKVEVSRDYLKELLQFFKEGRYEYRGGLCIYDLELVDGFYVDCSCCYCCGCDCIR